MWISEKAIREWEPAHEGHRGGQLRYSDLAIETALTLRLVFRLPLRQTEGFIRSLFALMELELSAPDHTTLSRRNRTLSVRLPERARKGNKALIVDSTGLAIVDAGKWQRSKHGTKARRQWRKLHIAVDGEGKIISSKLTGRQVDDASVVPALLKDAGNLTTFIGDGAYDDGRVYDVLDQHQRRAVKVVIPPRKTAVPSRIRSGGAGRRNKNIRWRRRVGKRQWQKEAGYHQQARAENTFYRYKTILGGALRARLLGSQERESRLACGILNRMRAYGASQRSARHGTALGMPVSEKIP